MVKRFIFICIAALLLSSCAFFGSTAFPYAVSEDVSWFVKNVNMRYFYILDNGTDDALLLLVGESGGTYRALVFDTSLNLRGYMEDGVNGVTMADGAGFVDHDGSYVIGQTRIGRNGTTGASVVTFVNIPTPVSPDYNIAIIPVDDAGSDAYIRMDNTGTVEELDAAWATPQNNGALPVANYVVVPQSSRNLSDIKIATQTGEIYGLTKQAILDHIQVSAITVMTPEATANGDYTQWVTRCSQGYFVSSYNGEFVMLDYSGNEQKRISNKHYIGQIVTIDYDCGFYYVVDDNSGRILKERAPF